MAITALLGPFCPKCSASMEPSFVRSSADSRSVVKMRCKGGKADELAYHEFSLATPQDFAQFFHAAAPVISPEPKCPKCGSARLDVLRAAIIKCSECRVLSY